MEPLANMYIKNQSITFDDIKDFIKIARTHHIKMPEALVKHFNKLEFNELQLYIILGHGKHTQSNILKKYINKVNHMLIEGECPICYDYTNLIPFDCCHYVCSENCYPSLIYKKVCPICKLKI